MRRLALCCFLFSCLACNGEATEPPRPSGSVDATTVEGGSDATLDLGIDAASETADGFVAGPETYVPSDVREDGPTTGVIDGKLHEGGYAIVGVTPDDWVALSGGSGNRVVSLHTKAVELLGGGAEVLLDRGGYFAWSGLTGPLSVWSYAFGRHELTSTASTGRTKVAATLDGKHVAFVDEKPGTEATLVYAWANGAGRVAAAGIYTGCTTTFRFFGDRLVASYCRAKGGWAVSVVDGAGALTEMIPEAAEFDVDGAGKNIFAWKFGGDGYVVPMAGGKPLKIAERVSGGRLTADGAALVYLTDLEEVRRTPTTVASPVTLVSKAQGVWLTPDPTQILFAIRRATDATYDLHLASATAASTDVVLQANISVSTHTFTSDGSTVLWLGDFNTHPAIRAGTLFARKLAAGTNKTIAGGVVEILPLAGTQIVFRVRNGSTVPATHDLMRVDVASTSEPVLIASKVTSAAVSSKRTHVVYATDEGIFVRAIP